MNSALVWGGVFTVLRGGGFLLVMAYALRCLPAADIGLWYVMLGIAGLAGFVDLGFSATIGRYVSYYAGGAEGIPGMGLSGVMGADVNWPAIRGLIAMARDLYRLFALILGLMMIMAGVGWWWFSAVRDSVGMIGILAFSGLIAGTVLNMTGLYWGAVLYGLGKVRLLNQWMALGLVFSYAVSLTGLLHGFGLLALAAGQVVGALIPRIAARILVVRDTGALLRSEAVTVSWRDLWPMTWRSGLISLCSFLTIGITPVLCSLFCDIATTAKYGLSMQMAVMLHTTSALWIWVRIPEISALRARGDWERIRHLVVWRLPISMATYLLGAVLVVALAPRMLGVLGSRTELLPTVLLVVLLLLMGLDLLVGHHSALLQVGNETPHLKVYIIAAALTWLLVWPLGTKYHVWGLMAAPFLSQLILSYWWTPCRFWRQIQAGIRSKEVQHGQ